nr:DUF3025 domain-containing protein [Ramlibacter algicola]
MGEAAHHRWAGGARVADALNASGSAPVQFVSQSAMPEGAAYERFIFEQRACPTRDNLHDFFNGLAWLHLPRTKQRLNALQAAEIGQNGIGARRGPVRDAITVFDENGLLLRAPEPLWAALRERAWRRLFVDLRPLWAEAHVLIVGHALLEKLAAPRKDMTAHVWDADAPLPGVAAADAWLAAQCEPGRLAAKPFVPLPVLGIPGWWAENENFSFYDDSEVFRPRRPARGGGRDLDPCA